MSEVMTGVQCVRLHVDVKTGDWSDHHLTAAELSESQVYLAAPGGMDPHYSVQWATAQDISYTADGVQLQFHLIIAWEPRSRNIIGPLTHHS